VLNLKSIKLFSVKAGPRLAQKPVKLQGFQRQRIHLFGPLNLLERRSSGMLKKRIVALVTGLALLLAVAGASGIVADSLGFSVTSPAHACTPQGSGGGG
jgi:hypothetical protein